MSLPLNIDFQQILLHLINFTILFVIMYLLLYKPVKKFMTERSQHYQEMDDQANDNLKKSEEARAEYEEKLTGVEDELNLRREQAYRQADEMGDKIIAKAKDEAAAIIEKAKAEAQSEKEKIINSTSDEITDMATAAAAKVVFESTSEAFDRFLDSTEGSGDNAEK